jgi:hypothetical protein
VSNRVRSVSLLLVIAAGLSGCATSELWEKGAFDGFNEPARPTNLGVFETPGDWLIVYDEVSEKNGRIRRRAYYLNRNQDLVNRRKKPQFVSASEADAFRSASALLSSDGRQFTIYDGSTEIGTYELPIYPAPSGRVKQILLTPCTLVVDATVAGAILGLYWLQMGGPGANCN